MSVTLRQVIRLIIHGSLFWAIVVVTSACGNDRDDVTPAIVVTPAAGGMIVPTAVNTTPEITTPENTTPEITAPIVLFTVGQQVVATDRLLLRADADISATVMNQYPAATQLEVLAPSGDYDMYPVHVRDGVTNQEIEWYRLRSPDGLVGWATADRLAAVP